MKYAPHWYARALAEAIMAPGADGRTIARNFKALLARNGDERQARKILEEAARFARGREGIRKVAVESARTLTPAQRGSLGAFLRPGDVVEEEIAPELVAGVRVFVDDERLYDGSLKGKLDALFDDIGH